MSDRNIVADRASLIMWKLELVRVRQRVRKLGELVCRMPLDIGEDLHRPLGELELQLEKLELETRTIEWKLEKLFIDSTGELPPWRLPKPEPAAAS